MSLHIQADAHVAASKKVRRYPYVDGKIAQPVYQIEVTRQR